MSKLRIPKQDIRPVLCLNTAHYTRNNLAVQRKIDLEKLVNEDCKLFYSVPEARKKGYEPLDFAVSVRSMYDNTVVQCAFGDKDLYYVNMTQVCDHNPTGAEFIMYISGLCVLEMVNYVPNDFDEVMMRHSQFMPVGLYFSSLCYPIVYSHVIMSDGGMKQFEKFLKEGNRVVPISQMKRENNVPALLDTIFEVYENKGEEHNEP